MTAGDALQIPLATDHRWMFCVIQKTIDKLAVVKGSRKQSNPEYKIRRLGPRPIISTLGIRCLNEAARALLKQGQTWRNWSTVVSS